MGVCFVLLTLGASFDVFLYILSQLRPPVVLGHQFFCSIDAWVSVTFSPRLNSIISSITTGLPRFFIVIPHPPIYYVYNLET